MTRRRIIEPGQIWALSRRTTRRYYLLAPDEAGQVRRLYWYALAYAAQKHGVVVHAACLMSTHSHEVVTDVRGELPKFLQTFHRLLALSIKALRGWPEEVFNKRSSGAHRLLTTDAVIEAVAYVITNPVTALAVRAAKDWPGAHTSSSDMGRRVIAVRRPRHYYRGDTGWPESLRLSIEMPTMLTQAHGDELARSRIRDSVRRRERSASRRARTSGARFTGAKRVVKMSHTKRARSYERFGKLNPRFSARGDVAAARRAARRLRAFNAEYDKALAAWRIGKRDVVFPYGTWWMKIYHGADCRPPPL